MQAQMSRLAPSRPAHSPNPRAPNAQSNAVPNGPNTSTKILDTVHGRILCIADIRGRLSALNDLARDVNAHAIIHTGDFGFFDNASLERINDRTLRHLTMYSPLIPSAQRSHLLAAENPPTAVRATVNIALLSEFPLLLSGQIKLSIPVYTVWGACEDVAILEKFRSGIYNIENIHILDEATTRCIDLGGVRLRLLGLGGALVPHKLFDNGDGHATIAGGQGTMWTTALQIGELVDTAQRVHDPTETRLLVTHAAPGREGIIAQLALVLKADLTISAGLHFRYASSYNEFSVQNDFAAFRQKLASGKDAFDKVWETVKSQVDAVIDEHQRVLLDKALSVVERVPSLTASAEEPAWKNCWNWNLCDAAYGSLVLDVKEGRISSELKSQGFNYAYRRTATPAASATSATPSTATNTLPPKNHITNNVNISSTPPRGPATPGLNKPSTPTPSTAQSTPGSKTSALQNQTHSGHQNSSHNLTQPPVPSGSSSALNAARSPPPTTAASASAEPAVGNGVVAGTGNSNAQDKSPGKSEREKAKKNVKKSRDVSEPIPAAGIDSPTPDAPDSKSSTPIPPASGSDAALDGEDPKSPTTDNGNAGGGARTPTSKKPTRNPWTLLVKLNVTATDAEMREFFGGAKEGIVRVNFPQGKMLKWAFVEFGDEEAMKAGLAQHAPTFKDTTPEVTQANTNNGRGSPHEYRGGGRGRGRGRGFNSRGFATAGAAAGLTNRPGGGSRQNGSADGGGE